MWGGRATTLLEPSQDAERRPPTSGGSQPVTGLAAVSHDPVRKAGAGVYRGTLVGLLAVGVLLMSVVGYVLYD